MQHVRKMYVVGEKQPTGRFEWPLYFASPGSNHTAARGLARLLRLVSDKRLKSHISVTGSWEDIGETAVRLLGREFSGKAVLSI